MRDLLLIGPLPSNNKLSIGGTTISFKTFVDFIAKTESSYFIITINSLFFKGSMILNAALVIFKAIFLIPFSRLIMFNANPRGAKYLTPFIYYYTRLWRRKFVFRMFGGDLIEFYQEQSSFFKKMMRETIFKSDITYLQTKRLIQFFEPHSEKIKWLPTSRKSHKVDLSGRSDFNRRFVFISQIKETKGIDLLINLIEDLPDSYTIHLYGPILEKKYEFLENENYYKGSLTPEKVIPVIGSYDVLLLPTFHPGEGYPGIIIEANSIGVPVITTEWLALPELVIHEKTGIVIKPRSYDDLIKAVKSIDSKKYKALSSGAINWFENFDSDKINARISAEFKSLLCAV